MRSIVNFFISSNNPKITPVSRYTNAESTPSGVIKKTDRISDFFNPGPINKRQVKKNGQ